MEENTEEARSARTARVYAANLVVGERLGRCEGNHSSVGRLDERVALAGGGGGVVNCYISPGLRFDCVSSKCFKARTGSRVSSCNAGETASLFQQNCLYYVESYARLLLTEGRREHLGGCV